MSEKESQFIKQLRAWIVTGILGMAFTGVGFYYTTNAKIMYMEQQNDQLKNQHFHDIQEIKSDIKEINNYLRDHK